jgi:hypothetical protein
MVRLAVVLWLTACGYEDPNFDGTLFRCDETQACPEGFFCNNSRGGVCIETSRTGCRDQELDHYWGFDSQIETDAAAWQPFANQQLQNLASFAVSYDATSSFVATGSLRIAVTGASDPDTKHRGWIFPPGEPEEFGDLSGRIFSARAMTPDSGVLVKVTVEQPEPEPPSTFEGGFGPGQNLQVLNAWECVFVDVSSPAFVTPNYDPTTVTKLGLEIHGPVPMTLFIDDAGF